MSTIFLLVNLLCVIAIAYFAYKTGRNHNAIAHKKLLDKRDRTIVWLETRLATAEKSVKLLTDINATLQPKSTKANPHGRRTEHPARTAGAPVKLDIRPEQHQSS